MSWTTVECDGRHDLFNDFDLWTLKHFFLAQTATLESTNPDAVALREFFERWDWLGPGVIVGADIGRFLEGSPSRRELLNGLLNRTVEHLLTFGSEIPLSYLAAKVNEPGRGYTKEQPVESFIHAIRRIQNLINPKNSDGD